MIWAALLQRDMDRLSIIESMTHSLQHGMYPNKAVIHQVKTPWPSQSPDPDHFFFPGC